MKPFYAICRERRVAHPGGTFDAVYWLRQDGTWGPWNDTGNVLYRTRTFVDYHDAETAAALHAAEVIVLPQWAVA